MVAVVVRLVAPAAGKIAGVGRDGNVGRDGAPVTFPPVGAGPI